MPTRAPRNCNKAGCRQLNQRGTSYCVGHQAEAEAGRRAYDARRPSARHRLYDSRWDKARKGYLAKHPLCVHCLAEDVTTAANEVDHIIPHRGDKVLFWDRNNWQSLCKTHHSRKTATEDSGFARRGPRI